MSLQKVVTELNRCETPDISIDKFNSTGDLLWNIT